MVVWAAAIFAFSAQPATPLAPDPGLSALLSKLAHVFEFGVLAILVWLAVDRTTHWRPAWVWALAVTVAYAVTDELHQAIVPTRYPSGLDVVIDAVGAAIGLAAVAFVRSRGAERGP